jgi:hypothetical protein
MFLRAPARALSVCLQPSCLIVICSTLEARYPTVSCKHCGGTEFSRVSMHKKNAKMPKDQLQESADEVSRWL